MNAKLAAAIKEIEDFAVKEAMQTAELDALFAKSASAYYAAADQAATPEVKKIADEIESAIEAAVARRDDLRAARKAKSIEVAKIFRELGDNDTADIYEIAAM